MLQEQEQELVMSETKTNQGTVTPQTRPQNVATNPWASLRTDIDRLFEDFTSNFGVPSFVRGWQVPGFANAFGTAPFKTPAVDMTEDDNAYHVAAELPGLTEADVHLTLSGEMLMLKADKKAETTREEANVRISERSFGSFQRAFQVPTDVDTARIHAKFTNGVLNIVLPKAASAKPASRTIEVKAGG
jgi:HSP20 family protein